MFGLRVITVFVFLLAAVGIGFFFATRYFLEESEPATAQPPGPGQIEELNERLREDALKPRFEGEIGDFVVISPDQKESVQEFITWPCTTRPIADRDKRPIDSSVESELFFTPPIGFKGSTIATALFCPADDGVLAVEQVVFTQSGSANVSRVYFTSPKYNAFISAPKERIELRTINGKSALMEVPVSGDHWVQLFVIERFPAGGRPGAVIAAHSILGVDDTVDLITKIMQQNPIKE